MDAPRAELASASFLMLGNSLPSCSHDREIYWISYFNSKKKGYNQLYGGSGGKRYDLDEQEVIERYNKLQNIVEVEKEFNVPKGVIPRILRKHNIKILSSQNVVKNKNKTVYQYDLNGNLINKFDSFIDAGNWLIENNLSSAKNGFCASSAVRYALLRGNNNSIGFYWKCKPEFTKKEIEEFIIRREIQNKLRNEKAKEKRKQNSKKNKPKRIKSKEMKYREKKISICPICGNQKASKSELCDKCNREQLHNKSEQQREEKYGVTRDILKQEIREMRFLQISKKYGISDNAIRKWCKRYNLPYKASEIKRYTDEEWEKV